MKTQQIEVNASKALFIKLGQNGEWERECINDGSLRLGYHDVPHEYCRSSDWERARKGFPSSADPGSVTRHLNQVQQFYEEPSTTLWITFFSDRLWWCFSAPNITQLPDKSKTRPVIGSWSDKDINGTPLLKGRLSGKLLAVQGFQGTICSVKEREYLLHKINGTSEPHVEKAQEAVERLVSAVVPIIRNLHYKDLETLTDLIFRQAGWKRTGVVGEVEKDIDLDLLSPITRERIAVQVKSKASEAIYRAYREKYSDMRGFRRFYFITHSPDPVLEKIASESTDGPDDPFVIWDANQLARQSVHNGLVDWLIDKAS